MKIHTKLMMAFVTVTVLMAIVGTASYVQNRNTKTSATEDLYQVVSDLDYAWMLVESQQQLDLVAKDYLFVSDHSTQASEAYLKEKERTETLYRAYYEDSSGYVRQMLEKYDADMKLYTDAIEAAFVLSEDGADFEVIAEQVDLADQYIGGARRNALDPILNYVHSEQLGPAKDSIEDSIDQTTMTITISSVLAVLLAIGLGFYVSKTIVDPISRLKAATLEIGKGNLETSIQVQTKDEIGELAQSFNQMVHDLKEVTASRDELGTEVAHRKEAEEKVKREKDNLLKILENHSDGIIITDINEMVRFINPAAHMLFGQMAEELLGHLFGVPVVVGETTQVNIIRQNGEGGIGEMRVMKTEWEGNDAYLISIRDISEVQQG